MSSIIDCCAFGDYEETNACAEYTGGNDALILIKKGVDIGDTTDEAAVQAVIDAGNAKKISGLKISINRPEAVRQDSSRACTPQTVTVYNASATIMDGKATASNIDFWSSVDASTGCIWGMAIIHSCSGGEQFVATGNILIIGGGGLQSPLSDEEVQDIELTMEWKAKTYPISKEAANPIFNS